jgi:hypothetical protein
MKDFAVFNWRYPALVLREPVCPTMPMPVRSITGPQYSLAMGIGRRKQARYTLPKRLYS